MGTPLGWGAQRAWRCGLALACALGLMLVAVPAADARVYWTNYGSGTIGRADLAGTSAIQSFITGAGSPRGVAVVGPHIYWANTSGGTIGRANLDGTGANVSFITGASAPIGAAVGGAHIYWANVAADSIGRADLGGTSASQSFITGADAPQGVVVDGAHVYWTNAGNNTIGRANLDGTGVNQSFITGASGPVGVAVDGAHVYWTNFSGNTIGRANLDGTGVNHSFMTAASPVAVAVDGAHVYWTNQSGNTIGRANLDGTGANQSFIVGADNPSGLAVTALETSITQGPAGTVGSDSASFSFSASEPAGFECRLDSQPFAACGSPKTYGGLANGRHSFQVRARDSAGNVDPTPPTRSWSVNVAGAIADTTGPQLSTLRLSRSVFAAATRGPSIARRRARVQTTVSYRLSEPATVRFRVLGRAAGRMVNGTCHEPTRRNRRGRRCDLPLRGSFSHQGAQGINGVRFRGRLSGRKLKPGRYHLTATATDAAGNRSSTRRAPFRIVRR